MLFFYLCSSVFICGFIFRGEKTMFDFNNRVVIITGAAGQFGLDSSACFPNGWREARASRSRRRTLAAAFFPDLVDAPDCFFADSVNITDAAAVEAMARTRSSGLAGLTRLSTPLAATARAHRCTKRRLKPGTSCSISMPARSSSPAAPSFRICCGKAPARSSMSLRARRSLAMPMPRLTAPPKALSCA